MYFIQSSFITKCDKLSPNCFISAPGVYKCSLNVRSFAEQLTLLPEYIDVRSHASTRGHR